MKFQKRRLLLTTLALTVATFGTAAPSDAKCPFASYRLSVQIVEEPTGKPVAGARVSVFANASDRELAQRDPSAEPTETGADGVFAAEYWFNTYSGGGSGIFGGHRCHERVKSLAVVVTHPRYRARRITLTGKELKLRRGTDTLTFEAVLPTIHLP